jgi:hypothetical protein
VLLRIRSAARRAPRRVLNILRAVPGEGLRTVRAVGVSLQPVVAVPYRHFGRGVRLRQDRLGAVAQLALLVAGVTIGLILALPVQVSERRCPARGEGYDLCWVQKALAPSVLIILASLLLAQFLARLLLVRVPAWRQRVREVGERRVGEQETREEPPYRSDPFLLASTWGAKDGRTERRRPRLFERAPELLARLRRR